jgi:hypothetical protein
VDEYQPIEILLHRVMIDIGAVEKTGWNESQKFNFRTIDDAINAAHKALTLHGVIAVPEIVDKSSERIATKNGNPAQRVELTVRYRFVGPKGDEVAATVASEGIDYGDKATSKAMSMALKYALFHTLMIPTMEADPDSESYEIVPEPTITAEEVVQITNWFDKFTDGEQRKGLKDAFVDKYGCRPLELPSRLMSDFYEWAGQVLAVEETKEKTSA